MRRILVIDDKMHVRATIMSILRRSEGFEIVAVGDGISGLKKFDETTFDLAIVDLYMPEIDGVKVIREIRKRIPNFPVIAMSGELLRHSHRTALDIFPNAADLSEIVCLKKPFRSAELLAAVAKATPVAA